MPKGKKYHTNSLSAQVKQLEEALDGSIEQHVIRRTLKDVNGDFNRALDLLINMLAERVDNGDNDLVTCPSSPHYETENQPNAVATAVASPQPSAVESDPDNSNDSCEYSDNQSEDSWTFLMEMFTGLLSIDELADMYQSQNCDVESTISHALQSAEDDYYQMCDTASDPVLEALASLTSEQSAVVEELERMFTEADLSAILAASHALDFDLQRCATALLDGVCFDESAFQTLSEPVKPSRTYVEATAGQQAGSIVSKLTSANLSEEEFPALNTPAKTRQSATTKPSVKTNGLSIADSLKLRQLKAMFPSCSKAELQRLYFDAGRSADRVAHLLRPDRDQQHQLSSTAAAQPSKLTKPRPQTQQEASAESQPQPQQSSPTDTRAPRKNGRHHGYVSWTTIDNSKRTKKRQPEKYIPGLNNASDAPEIDTEEHWREQAQLARHNMRDAFMHAARLRRNLGGGGAHEAAARGKECQRLMNIYNGRAAACALRSRNVGIHATAHDNTGHIRYHGNKQSDDQSAYSRVDLHGLRVQEAIQFLSSFIETHRANQNKVSIDAITGAGRNSAGGRSKLLPAVVRLLNQEQLAYTIHTGYVRFKV